MSDDKHTIEIEVGQFTEEHLRARFKKEGRQDESFGAFVTQFVYFSTEDEKAALTKEVEPGRSVVTGEVAMLRRELRSETAKLTEVHRELTAIRKELEGYNDGFLAGIWRLMGWE